MFQCPNQFIRQKDKLTSWTVFPKIQDTNQVIKFTISLPGSLHEAKVLTLLKGRDYTLLDMQSPLLKIGHILKDVLKK